MGSIKNNIDKDADRLKTIIKDVLDFGDTQFLVKTDRERFHTRDKLCMAGHSWERAAVLEGERFYPEYFNKGRGKFCKLSWTSKEFKQRQKEQQDNIKFVGSKFFSLLGKKKKKLGFLNKLKLKKGQTN